MSSRYRRSHTADDLADEQRMREEDEDLDADGTSEEGSEEESDEDEDEELEQIMDFEERMPIVEPGDESEDDEDEDDEEEDHQSTNSSFQARLERLRKGSQNGSQSKSKDKGKGKAKSRADSEDDDSDDDIHDILDENEDILNGRDKKAKKELFQAVYNGGFEDIDMWKPARKAKDKYKDLPPNLADLWQKGQAKKAAYKQKRELARLSAAADPLLPNKGGKKGRKATRAAAKLDPTITVLPNRVIDITTLVQQIRRFIDDVGGPKTMSLPPAKRQTRKDVHELANAFGLKSQSRGKGDSRYTTLTKTTMTGVRVNQKKVAKIVRRGGGGELVGGSDIWKKHAERSKGMPRHKEGDEVGKAAPKINEMNIGFKMLASMGWTDGDPIGSSVGGLQNPLTAVIKHTKLGLGATK
ncbi:hypothetical protein BT96DRAFT_1021482 [Gymnopus androsaceus JB14]|uniref:Protein SQS1 n=1 Tax=Gymnopus androsaceus JB14 TaxID=1447944 RepID=A0A6A4HD04_9AGAR|nr:hypothetical protein BT96DRAFT_1021482 [Gymnopus androsaceus JB14]